MSRTFIGGVGSAFFSQGDRLIVGRLLGLEASGFYAAITSVATQIHTLSTISIQPLVATLSTLVAQQETEGSTYAGRQVLQSTISRALMINATLAVGLGGFIVMLAPEISAFLFKEGSPFSFDTANALKITACIYTLYSLNAVGYYMLLAIKRELTTTVVALVCGPFSLLLIGLLANFYGVTGALIGNAGYLFTLFMLWYGFKSFRLSSLVWAKALWRPLLIFAIIIGMSVLIGSTVNKIMVLCFIFSVMILPMLKEGWQHISLSRKSQSL